MALQDEAAALLARAGQPDERRGRLNPEDRALILRLGAKGTLTQEEIAKAVGCDQSTVSRVLQLLDTRKEARTILESGSAKLAQTVVDTDDAGIALKALAKLDVVREDREGTGVSVGPIIIIGHPPDTFDGFKDGDRLSVKDLPMHGQALCVLRPTGGAHVMRWFAKPEMLRTGVPEFVLVEPEAEPLLVAMRTELAAPVTINVTPIEVRDAD